MATKGRVGKYFYIRSQVNASLVLEIQNGVDRPCAPVVTAETLEGGGEEAGVGLESNDHQLWFCDIITGTIRNKLNHFCLDLKDDLLVVQPFHRGKSGQQWLIQKDLIQSRDDSEMVLGVTSDASAPGIPVVAAQADDGSRQRWTFEHRPAQYFYIRSHEEHKVMDVKKNDSRPGAQVVLWQDKGDMADNQLWYEDQDGIIRSKLNGFTFDTSGKHVVLMPLDRKSEHQQWVIGGNTVQSRVSPERVLQALPGGFLSRDQPLAAADFTGQVGQLWYFDYLPDQGLSLNHGGRGKHFIVRSRVSGLLLEVHEGKSDAGTPCVLNERRTLDHQLFYMDEPTATIRTALNEFCLQIDDGHLVVNPYDPYSKQQQWRVLGRKIVNKHNPELVLGADSDRAGPGTRISAEQYEGRDTQHWDVTHVPAKYFYVISMLNGKVLDVCHEEASAGAAVIMWERKEGVAANQLWYEDEHGILRSRLNGYVPDTSAGRARVRPYDPTSKHQQWVFVGDRIQNRDDRQLCLDVEKESKKNNASIVSYKYHGGNNQRWSIEYV
nr:ricin lectin domain-containing protein 7 [Arenicola marina]